MDLRLSDEQRSLREDAAAFCARLRPLLESDPEWRRQGMLSDGDSVAVNRALGEAGWIDMSWPPELGGIPMADLTAGFLLSTGALRRVDAWCARGLGAARGCDRRLDG